MVDNSNSPELNAPAPVLARVLTVKVTECSFSKLYYIDRYWLESEAPSLIGIIESLELSQVDSIEFTNLQIETFDLFVDWLEYKAGFPKSNPPHACYKVRSWSKLLTLVKLYLFGAQCDSLSLRGDVIRQISSYMASHISKLNTLPNAYARMFINRDMALEPILYVYGHTEPGSLLREYFVDCFCAVSGHHVSSWDSLRSYPKDFLVDLIVKKSAVTITRQWNLTKLESRLKSGRDDVDATQAPSLTIAVSTDAGDICAETRIMEGIFHINLTEHSIQQNFYIAESILELRAPGLGAALSEDTISIEGVDIDIETLTFLVAWLKIDPEDDDLFRPLHKNPVGHHYWTCAMPLIKLYILACESDIPTLASDALSRFTSLPYLIGGRNHVPREFAVDIDVFPTLDEINYIYKHTAADCPLRHIVVNAFCNAKEDIDYELMETNHEFLVDVVLHMRGPKADWEEVMRSMGYRNGKLMRKRKRSDSDTGYAEPLFGDEPAPDATTND